MSERKPIPINIMRQLWAQCGGYCQNPSCNKELFRDIGEDIVSIANMAHIIGQGKTGPRSEHQLAKYIDVDGFGNLIMLCLECHKVVDELEKTYTVEVIQTWKNTHAQKIHTLFSIPDVKDERKLLAEVNDLLDTNGELFRECGPYSSLVIGGLGGDGLKVWKKRCRDSIIPNNRRIIELIERNKKNFPYPWEVYNQMLAYKIHAEAFQDNVLADQKVNDYKLFPRGFDHFIKSKLGIHSLPPETVAQEEIELRRTTIRTYIDRFLREHNAIANFQELNRATLLVELRAGRTLKVFVTNTYFFTDHTLDRILETDPAIDAIICSCPAGQYSDSAKRECIDRGIGLFKLSEFMGAINKSGDAYLNFLLKEDFNSRIERLKWVCKQVGPPTKVRVFVFGSYIRRKLFQDVDLMIVYEDETNRDELTRFESELERHTKTIGLPHIDVKSARDFETLKWEHGNHRQVYP